MSIINAIKRLATGTLKVVAILAIWSMILFPTIFGIYHTFTKHSEARGLVAFLAPPYAWFMTLEAFFLHKDAFLTMQSYTIKWREDELCNAYLIVKSINVYNGIDKIELLGAFNDIYTPTEKSIKVLEHSLNTFQDALLISSLVKNSTLTKIHPELENIWRNEYEQSIEYYAQTLIILDDYYKNGGIEGHSQKETTQMLLTYQTILVRAQEAEKRYLQWRYGHSQSLALPELQSSIYCDNVYQKNLPK